ncbi:surface-adhesin E family protein [Qipengyuania sp. 902]|uniref:surface-adhesin E family protein n=1 Tax=Qipengyuania sp. 902 TaxID=3417565 RepID=UPI003EB9A113
MMQSWRFQYVALALVAAAFPNVSVASDWRYLTSGTTGVIVKVDVESVRELPAIQIRRPFPVRQIWVLMDFSQDKSVTYRERRQLFRFNCTAETSMIASSVTYNPDGRVARSWSDEDYDFKYEPETPDTIGYTIMEFACGRRSLP